MATPTASDQWYYCMYNQMSTPGELISYIITTSEPINLYLTTISCGGLGGTSPANGLFQP